MNTHKVMVARNKGEINDRGIRYKPPESAASHQWSNEGSMTLYRFEELGAEYIKENPAEDKEEESFIPQYGEPALYGGSKNVRFETNMVTTKSHLSRGRLLNSNADDNFTYSAGTGSALRYVPSTESSNFYMGMEQTRSDGFLTSKVRNSVDSNEKQDTVGPANIDTHDSLALHASANEFSMSLNDLSGMMEMQSTLFGNAESLQSLSDPEILQYYPLLGLEFVNGDTPLNHVKQETKAKFDRKRKPDFHLPLDNLQQNSAMISKMNKWMSNADLTPNYEDPNIENLRLMEPDIEFGFDNGIGLNIGHDDTTPSMKPPGTNQNGYFDLVGLTEELKLTGSVQETLSAEEEQKRMLTPGASQTTSLFSGIGYFDVGTKNENLGHTHKNVHTNNGSNKFKPETEKLTKIQGQAPAEEQLLISNNRIYVTVPRNFMEVPRRPAFERTDSSQSATSIGSASSTTKKKRTSKGAVCTVCEKYISRDLTRHMRIHDEVGRFQCVYPKSMCNHKKGYFNRPYDYKKHLLHTHFKFDDPKGKTVHTLTDKLPLMGTCLACGFRASASDWLDTHILTKDPSTRCHCLKND